MGKMRKLSGVSKSKNVTPSPPNLILMFVLIKLSLNYPIGVTFHIILVVVSDQTNVGNKIQTQNH